MNTSVAEAESQLGVRFPGQLRRMYEEGDGRFNEAGRWWVVWRLQQLIDENGDARRRGLPASLLAFGDDGAGNPFCLDVGKDTDEVVRWSWIDSAVERTEGSLDEWISEWVEQRP